MTIDEVIGATGSQPPNRTLQSVECKSARRIAALNRKSHRVTSPAFC
jgi:hypothetical protein